MTFAILLPTLAAICGFVTALVGIYVNSGRFNSIDARFNSIDARLSSVDARLSSLEGRVSDFGQCLSHLEVSLGGK